MLRQTITTLIYAVIWSLALFGLAILLTGCAETKYFVRCTTDPKAVCN